MRKYVEFIFKRSLSESLGVFWYFGILNWTFCSVKGLYGVEVDFIYLL